MESRLVDEQPFAWRSRQARFHRVRVSGFSEQKDPEFQGSLGKILEVFPAGFL